MLASHTGTAVIQEGETSYSQVFPDKAVALKPAATPAMAKKQKPMLDLGLTPLTYQSTSSTQVTLTITAPTQGSFAVGICAQGNAAGSKTLSQETVTQVPVSKVCLQKM